MCRCFSKPAPYRAPSTSGPMPRPTATFPLSQDPGGFSAGFSPGLDIAGPPFPADWRSSVPVIPPKDGPSYEGGPATYNGGFSSAWDIGVQTAAGGAPLPPGYQWAGNPCAPQRADTETYRRAVHLGLITPTTLPATNGVANDAAERAAEAYFANVLAMHQRGGPDAVQVFSNTQGRDIRDYDHGAFSPSFG